MTPPTQDEPLYVVILWHHGGRGRPFETLSDPATGKPIAYSLSYLQNHHFRLFHAATLVHTMQELESWTKSILFPTVTRNAPLLVPVELVKTAYGWADFAYNEGE